MTARWITALLLVLCLPLPAEERPVSFRNDVMAVLAKGGCNSGPCHGNANGKAGFKISLRGEDPEYDYNSLVRDMFGRRINTATPGESLLLLKATATVAHEGGKRFDHDSLEYEILKKWIAAGAEPDPENTPTVTEMQVTPRSRVLLEPDFAAQLSVTAGFSDGSKRDITRLAVYEPASLAMKASPGGLITAENPGETTVMVRYLNQHQPVHLAFVPARPDFKWSSPRANSYVDRHIDAKLRTLRMNPSAVTGDHQFLRRAYLDLLGVLPTAGEARAFVLSPDKKKRQRLIRELLDRPEFAEHWATKWADLLRIEEKALDRKGVELFHRWIRESIADNKPVDQFVREIITARGSTYQNPPANFYRSARTPITRAETAAQVFLGTRLQCAQCHNHPFDKWTQDDYYDWAGLFARIDYKVLENRYRDGLDKHAFEGEQIVFTAMKGEVKNPRIGKDSSPRFLGRTEPIDDDQDRLQELAAWLTGPENRLFARVQANRIWYHLMGRGIVDPIDDFRATNLPSHPELLEELTADFVGSGYSLKHLVQVIMNSRAYQTSALPNDTNADDVINYSHAQVRRIDAEEMLDALSHVTGAPLEFDGYPEGFRAGQIPGVHAVAIRRSQITDADKFLQVFGKPERLLATEEERSCTTNLGQAFQLMTGPALTELLNNKNGRLDRMLAAGKTSGEMLDELYWTALARPPSIAENAAFSRHLEQAIDKRAALEDITWAIVNSKEFVMRH
ncbi:MAG TPA: hypothetical protein DCY13_00485 [Verrucomicrobiales bacterium]|nr:hypothetical protein [Verrucomicrobiales bacterium]